MSGPYDDIIHLSHPVSRTRKRMSMIDRAAQFSPFAALTGYDAAIREAGRLTENPIDLGMDAEAILNEKIRLFAQNLEKRPQISVTYFVPDTRKSGGSYVTVTGAVRKIDPYEETLLMEDGTAVRFRRIYDISMENGLF